MKIRQHLAAFGDMATKKVIKQFSTKHHFVYFGPVDAREDDTRLVRGLTVATTHTDNHYTVGTFNGHDLMLVERRNTLNFPGKASAEYKWLIMQVDLQRSGLPHIFIDAHRHDETFYANLFIKVPQFQDMASSVAHDPQFNARYKTFALPNQYAQVAAVLSPEITGTIAAHFHQFDYEIIDDRFYIYASKIVITPIVLQEMLRVGSWLADHLNQTKIPG